MYLFHCYHNTYEIGSWRVTSLPEGLARVIETDSPRSRTLVVSTFPTPLSRTGRTSFQVSGSPEKASSHIENKGGLMHLAAFQLNGRKNCFSCHPSPCMPLSSIPWQVVTSVTTTMALSPCTQRCLDDPAFRRLAMSEHDLGTPFVSFNRFITHRPNPRRFTSTIEKSK